MLFRSWLDKAEQVISEAIKLCRLYNNGYVTFLELHKLITIPNYYKEKINQLTDTDLVIMESVIDGIMKYKRMEE